MDRTEQDVKNKTTELGMRFFCGYFDAKLKCFRLRFPEGSLEDGRATYTYTNVVGNLLDTVMNSKTFDKDLYSTLCEHLGLDVEAALRMCLGN